MVYTIFYSVFPYEIKMLLVCPVCGSYIELNSEEFKELKNINVSNSEDIDNYGKTETQINFIKQMKESKEEKEKNNIKMESNNQIPVLDNNTIQNNSVIETNIEKDKVSVWTRLFAAVIDYGIGIGSYLLRANDSEIIKIVGSILMFVITITQIALLSVSGQTIGKKILKIKIVKAHTNTNGGFIRNYLVRSFLNLILYGTVIYGIIDIISIVRKDRRCVHDLIAGTKVVKV
ncbi:RDD family protein [Clostridium sp. DJ247]|uniref:RDD family protein n=1 Tax=Clostridium sp. DJ247 TaxID=2726188 RepID=UPI001628B0D1|nr:RDD family protein [Clostridium sp. DJ247]